MIVVQSERDLPLLLRVVPAAHFDAIAEWFNALAEAPDDGNSDAPRHLDGGCIRVLTEGDSGQIEPLLASWPDYAELVPTGAGALWKVVVMVDNDCLETWFAQQGMFPALDPWASQYLDN